MFNRFAAKVVTGSAIAASSKFSFWDEQRRANEFNENNEGKNFEMKYQSIAGTTGYVRPVESEKQGPRM